jgi:hypothetical protein
MSHKAAELRSTSFVLINVFVLQAPTVGATTNFEVRGKPNLRQKRIYDQMASPNCIGICCIRKQNETRKLLTSTITLRAENKKATPFISNAGIDNMKHATC